MERTYIYLYLQKLGKVGLYQLRLIDENFEPEQ